MFEVSTPGNPQYGNYLDADTANNLFAPTPEANVVVQAWLRIHGISEVKSDGHRLTFGTTVESANKLLGTSFRIYQNTDSGISNIRTTSYSIPDELVEFIDFITPTTYFGLPKSRQNASKSSHVLPKRNQTAPETPTYQFCSNNDPYQTITPACQKELYNVGNYTPEASLGGRIGFVTLSDLFTIYDDLFMFEELFNITKQNITTIRIDGASNNQTAGGYHYEGNLDADVIIGMAHPIPVLEFNIKTYPDSLNLTDGDYWHKIFSYFHTQPNWKLPQVISISYYTEDEEEIPLQYAKYICNLIGILGLRGITVMGCTGDLGLGYPCRSKTGRLQFNPVFPSGCPYFTAVGATMHVPEEGFYVSGGGFSNYFPTPSYQQKALQKYLDGEIAKEDREVYAQYANFSGRGFPDIALIGLR